MLTTLTGTMDEEALALASVMQDDAQDAETAQFLAKVQQTSGVVEAARKERGAKKGEMVVRATFEHFWCKGDNNKQVESYTPPPPGTSDKKDGSGTFPTPIPLQAIVEDFPDEIPGVCEKNPDGRSVWRIRWTLSYLPEAEALLVVTDPKTGKAVGPSQHTLAAWTPNPLTGELPQDQLSVQIRELCNAKGEQVFERMAEVSAGQSSKFKGGDRPGDVLRQKNAHGVYVVQPDVSLIFNNVVPTIYVNYDSGEPKPQRQGRQQAAKAATRGGVPDLPPSNAVTVAPTGTLVPAGPTVPKKEPSIFLSYMYECKGSILLRPDKEAADLCQSERFHRNKNKDAHQLVPFQEVRAETWKPRPSYYFYFRFPSYRTQWSPEHPEWLTNGEGVSIVRKAPHPEGRDFRTPPLQDGGVPHYTLRVDATVFQWHNRATVECPQYPISVGVARDNDTAWRSFGITNGESYAAIMTANPELPFHAMCGYWKNNSMKRPANNPEVMNAERGTEYIRGYHDFIFNEVVPDYLRYLRGCGMHVSPAFVKDEFFEWEGSNSRTKITYIELKPYPGTPANPLHALQGRASAVLSLGNGQPPPEKVGGVPIAPLRGHGWNHGYEGDIVPLLEGGRHAFYVMTSRTLNDEERARYCGPKATEPADTWLRDTIKSAAQAKVPFHYWIFAVDTQAKFAKPRTGPGAAPATVVPKVPALESSSSPHQGGGLKREREPDPVAAAADERRETRARVIEEEEVE